MDNFRRHKGKNIPLNEAEEAELLTRTPTNESLLDDKRKSMVLTPWQFRKAINQLGLRDRVEQLIESAPQDTVDGWKVATSFKRLNSLVVQFGNVIPLTDIEIDELFELGATFNND